MTVGVTPHFFNSYSKLGKAGQKRALETLERFGSEGGRTGFNLEKLTRSASNNTYSIRVDKSFRLILGKATGDTFVALYVDQHDDAYKWAETHRFEPNSATNMFQIFRSVETEQVSDPEQEYPKPDTPTLFQLSEEQLYQLGVPQEWIPEVIGLKTEKQFETLKDYLPTDAFEALALINAGEAFNEVLELLQFVPQTEEEKPHQWSLGRDIHIPETNEALCEMLQKPLEEWRIFLHPSQEVLVNRCYRGPVRVSGGPGTGKTVVAIHRASQILKKEPDSHIWLTVYDPFLADDLGGLLDTFLDQGSRSRVNVSAIQNWIAKQISIFDPQLKVREFDIQSSFHVWRELKNYLGIQDYTPEFLADEYSKIILPKNVSDLSSYLRVQRKGRGSALDGVARSKLIPAFMAFTEKMRNNGIIYREHACHLIREKIEAGALDIPFSHIIVDEVQDLGQSELKLLATMAKSNNFNEPQLFMVGDMNQRIHSANFSFADCGLSIQGRSSRLRLNYRTSRQIYELALKLSQDNKSEELISKTASLFEGDDPRIRRFSTQEEEFTALIDWIQIQLAQFQSRELCVVTRSLDVLNSLDRLIRSNNIPTYIIRGNNIDRSNIDGIRLSTIHRIKGLEFSSVYIPALNQNELPHKPSLRYMDDKSAQEDFIQREKNALFVACTRAKYQLAMSYANTPSEFLAPLAHHIIERQ